MQMEKRSSKDRMDESIWGNYKELYSSFCVSCFWVVSVITVSWVCRQPWIKASSWTDVTRRTMTTTLWRAIKRVKEKAISSVTGMQKIQEIYMKMNTFRLDLQLWVCEWKIEFKHKLHVTGLRSCFPNLYLLAIGKGFLLSLCC